MNEAFVQWLTTPPQPHRLTLTVRGKEQVEWYGQAFLERRQVAINGCVALVEEIEIGTSFDGSHEACVKLVQVHQDFTPFHYQPIVGLSINSIGGKPVQVTPELEPIAIRTLKTSMLQYAQQLASLQAEEKHHKQSLGNTRKLMVAARKSIAELEKSVAKLQK